MTPDGTSINDTNPKTRNKLEKKPTKEDDKLEEEKETAKFLWENIPALKIN